jgi:hypothetical protein
MPVGRVVQPLHTTSSEQRFLDPPDHGAMPHKSASVVEKSGRMSISRVSNRSVPYARHCFELNL